MAATADTNIGFKGQVTSANTPLIFGRPARYSVEGAGDLKVTKGGTGTWAVTVAAGTAWGDGVLSTWNGSTNLNGTSVSTGDRWDTLVIRRTWQPSSTPTGTSVLMLLAGGSAKALASSRTTDAGNTTSDQPIALVRFTAGQTAAQEVVDLRCWSHNGGLYAADQLAQTYLTDPGATFVTGSTLYVRVVTAAGTVGWDLYDLGRLVGPLDPALLGESQVVSFGTAQGGWATGTGSSGAGESSYALRQGNDVSLRLVLRRGTTIATSANGNIADVDVFKITNPAYIPRWGVNVRFTYLNTSGARFFGDGYIGTDGMFTITNLDPNGALAGTASPTWSAILTCSYPGVS